MHPLVRTHPETGRKSLFVDQSYLSRIEGISKDESAYMLDFLSSRVNDISLQCRFRWTKGAVAVWDERATQHSGSADHRGHPRTLRRCTVAGERPI
jgi:taurine dioxygenase